MIRTKLAQIIDDLATQKAYYLVKQAEYDKLASGYSQYDDQYDDQYDGPDPTAKLQEAQGIAYGVAGLLDFLPFETAYRLSDRLKEFSDAQTAPFTAKDAIKDLLKSELQRAHRKTQWRRFKARLGEALDPSNYVNFDSIPPEAVVLGAGAASGLGALKLWQLLRRKLR